MTRAARLDMALVAAALSAALVAPCASGADSTAGVKAGTVSIKKTSQDLSRSESSQVLAAEYTRFVSLGQAFFLGYRQSEDAKAQQTNYLAAYGGYRVYPLQIGHPRFAVLDGNDIHYDSFLKPYFDGGLSLGRARFQSLSAGELAADIIGTNLGAGLTFYIADKVVLDLGGVFEQFQSRGGAQTLALAGTNTYILAGLANFF